MKKEIREVNKEKGILQCTTVGERWYIKETTNSTTGMPEFEYVPSTTWICESSPRGIGFYRWLADKGWDESEAIKIAAGDKGSKVHAAIDALIAGHEVKIDSAFLNPSTDKQEELTLEEYEAVMSFSDWYKEAKPKILIHDFVVWGNGYAGTVDMLCEVDGKVYLVDFKTSQQVFLSHELQVSAYVHALPDGMIKPPVGIAILQIGYRKNKKRFKFTELEDKYAQFLAAKSFWENEYKDVKPLQRDYPLSLCLNIAGTAKVS